MAKELEIKDLSLSYGTSKILRNVSFKLATGSILALIGPNGAGKSSSMRILADLVRPQHGMATWQGEHIEFSDIRNIAGFYIETPSFYNYLSAKKNLELLQLIRKQGRSIENLLDLVGLKHAADMQVRKFSKGMKQRLGIAQALIGNPEILVLDEPFHGLDPEVKEMLTNNIIDLAKKENRALLISSHQLDDMEKIADHVVLIHKGKVKLDESLEKLQDKKSKVRFTFSKTLPKDFSTRLESFPILSCKEEVLEIQLKKNEIEPLVKSMVSWGYTPIQIQQTNLLHDKYLELTK